MLVIALLFGISHRNFQYLKRAGGLPIDLAHASPEPSALVDWQPTPVQATNLSLLLAVLMRNTGAAMVYTTTALASLPSVTLTIVIYTLLQHLVVGGLACLMQKRAT
jgi:hypothetical protein